MPTLDGSYDMCAVCQGEVGRNRDWTMGAELRHSFNLFAVGSAKVVNIMGSAMSLVDKNRQIMMCFMSLAELRQ